jgi:glucan phosphoethanolaminetransferase (alkaline phosphatase superfamily)
LSRPCVKPEPLELKKRRQSPELKVTIWQGNLQDLSRSKGGEKQMKSLRVLVPLVVTGVLTVLAVFSAIWLTGLVPAGPWAELIKAAIVIFIIGSAIISFAWSAYFTYIIRTTVERLLAK